MRAQGEGSQTKSSLSQMFHKNMPKIIHHTLGARYVNDFLDDLITIIADKSVIARTVMGYCMVHTHPVTKWRYI